MLAVANYIFIVYLLEIVVLCFLYKGSFAAKTKSINKYLYQTFVGIIVGLILCINIHFAHTDYGEIIAYAQVSIIVPCGIVFGP